MIIFKTLNQKTFNQKTLYIYFLFLSDVRRILSLMLVSAQPGERLFIRMRPILYKKKEKKNSFERKLVFPDETGKIHIIQKGKKK